MSSNFMSAIDIILEDYEKVLANRVLTLAPLKNSTIFITGGSGFMGTWLCGLLAYLNDQHHFNTQIFLLARNFDEFNLTRPHLQQRKDIHFISTDIRHPIDLPREIEWLVHGAATPDNRFHASNPLETMSVISNGTHTILRAVERCSHFKMFLNISSGLVYGPQPLELQKIPESFSGTLKYNTISSAYPEAKRYAETLCSATRSQARIPVITARAFAFMGPFQSLEMPWAHNNFIKDALSGDLIRVLGDGQSVRSYLYASDMAFWLLTILVRGRSGDIYNVGSSETTTLENLANLIAAQFNPQPAVKLRTSPQHQAQISRFIPDITTAQNNLQLDISVDLISAIKRTIKWNQFFQGL